MNLDLWWCAINRIATWVCRSTLSVGVMPVSKGIDVQKSRFAALALETSSESEEESAVGEWQTVKKGVSAGAGGGGKKKGGAQSAGQDGGENKPLSKNAKKRARKKRQQQQAQMATEVCITRCMVMYIYQAFISGGQGSTPTSNFGTWPFPPS